MRTIWLALVVIGFSPLHAFAQPGQHTTAPPRFVLSGGVLSDGDNTWGNSTPAAAGLTALAGVDLSRHVGVRLTFDLPRVATTISPTTTYRDASGSFRAMRDERHRSISWSVLVDGHGQVSNRIRAGFVTGITAARRPSQYDTSIDELAADGSVMRHTDYHLDSTFTWWGVTVGAELALSLTDHVAVVPDARIILFPLIEYGGASIVRPGVSVQWRFCRGVRASHRAGPPADFQPSQYPEILTVLLP